VYRLGGELEVLRLAVQDEMVVGCGLARRERFDLVDLWSLSQNYQPLTIA